MLAVWVAGCIVATLTIGAWIWFEFKEPEQSDQEGRR